MQINEILTSQNLVRKDPLEIGNNIELIFISISEDAKFSLKLKISLKTAGGLKLDPAMC